MDTLAIIGRCQEFQAELIPEGDRLRVRAPAPLPQDFMNELRRHKADILEELRKRPARPRLVEAPPIWHAETVAAAVEREGICIFWSELFQEVVAFIKDDSFKSRVPCGVVAYTVKELEILFGKGKCTEKELRLIHEAKKQGARVISRELKPEGGNK